MSAAVRMQAKEIVILCHYYPPGRHGMSELLAD
jgi:hypothetical protein